VSVRTSTQGGGHVYLKSSFLIIKESVFLSFSGRRCLVMVASSTQCPSRCHDNQFFPPDPPAHKYQKGWEDEELVSTRETLDPGNFGLHERVGEYKRNLDPEILDHMIERGDTSPTLWFFCCLL
jgi:hypothetical protein